MNNKPLYPLPTRPSSLRYGPKTLLQFIPNSIHTTNNDPNRNRNRIRMRRGNPQRTLIISCCSDSATYSSSPESAAAEEETQSPAAMKPVMTRKRRRYRKQYPGEKKGITEEMRFVAMRLRNIRGKRIERNDEADEEDENDDDEDDGEIVETEESVSPSNDGGGGETWQPSIEGFIKYIVDSKLVFDTVERIVDDSEDVSYAYFRRTGLERSKGLSKDLEWFSEQDLVIPTPSNPGITYAKYLEELAEKSAPLFLSHMYNIYFSHIAGGQVIAKQVSEKLLEGKELEFYRWDGDAGELLKDVRDKLNMLGEHWSRDEKNKCLREATKSFRFLGQIIRLIIL